MFNKLQKRVPILYAIFLILQRIISQIILPLFKTSRREWIIHFKSAAISLGDPHLKELKAIAILSQERVSFGRAKLGIESLKMLLMSFPNNSPSRPIRPALISKIALMAAMVPVAYGQQQRMLLQHSTMPWFGQCSSAQAGKWSRKFLAKLFPLCSCFHAGWNTSQPLKTGSGDLYEAQERFSGLKMVLPSESQYNNHSLCLLFLLHCVNENKSHRSAPVFLKEIHWGKRK